MKWGEGSKLQEVDTVGRWESVRTYNDTSNPGNYKAHPTTVRLEPSFVVLSL